MPKRTPVENAERRLRSWVKGPQQDSDVATDIRTLLAELERLHAIERRARVSAEHGHDLERLTAAEILGRL